MKTLRLIKNHIVFQFEDGITRRTDTGRNRAQFTEETEWGFEISSYDEGTKHPRWVIVKYVGPDVKEKIVPGMKILVDAMKWTEGVMFNGELLSRTDESHVLAIDADYNQ